MIKSGQQHNIYLSFTRLVVLPVVIIISLVNAEASMPVFSRLTPVSAIVNAPTDVALDTYENLYVVESINNRLLVFSQSGQYKDTLIGLSKPISVAVDNAGMIYIGNKDNGSVAVYDSNLDFVLKLGVGDWEFTQPNSIEIDNSGNIYVVDYVQNDVKLYNAGGTYLYCFGCQGNGDGQFEYPSSIVINRTTQEVTILDHPLTQVMFGQVKGARIQVFQVNGQNWTLLRSFGEYGDQEGQMNKPQGVEVDDLGRTYVTEAQYHVVYVYDSNGAYLGNISDNVNPMRTPLGIVRGDTNRMYIASLNTRQVEVYGLETYTNMNIVSPALTFQGVEYGADPASQNVEIRNDGTEVLDWSATIADSWITLSGTSGSIPVTTPVSSFYSLNVSVDLTGLVPGSYTGIINISAASGASETVVVDLTIMPNPPVANPGGTYSGVEGQSVLLDASNSTGGIVLYEWDINYDGNSDSYEYSSPSPTQSHSYSQQGVYTVKLRVTNQASATDTALTTVSISDSLPATGFTANPISGAGPLTVNFTNNSTGYDQPLSYEWDFDNDGNVDSTEQHPSYIYNSQGTYSVSLTVLDSDGSTSTLNMPNYITVSTAVILRTFKNGSGSGTVSSADPGIDCGADCEEFYSAGNTVTLSALPDAGSALNGWTGGGCSGTVDCVSTITTDIDITAAFDTCQSLPSRTAGNSISYFSGMQSAYSASVDGDTIESQAARFYEDLVLDDDKTVTLQGGYTCDYVYGAVNTRINGSITINSGIVTIGDYVIE